MVGKVFAAAAVVPALALGMAGCSGRAGDQPSTSEPSQTLTSTPTSTPSPTRSTPPATIPSVQALVCQSLNAELVSHTLAEIQALSAKNERAAVAKEYVKLAGELQRIATIAPPGGLHDVLVEWSTASLDVAAYVAEHEPEPGIVIDYGPPLKQWEAANKTAESLCGHKLPDATKLLDS